MRGSPRGNGDRLCVARLPHAVGGHRIYLLLQDRLATDIGAFIATVLTQKSKSWAVSGMPQFSKTLCDLFKPTLTGGADDSEKLVAATRESIHVVEQIVDEATIKNIAELCREIVLLTPRGEEGITKLGRLAENYRASHDPRFHAVAMARNLILADQAKVRQGDRDCLLASFGVVTLQVEIETFLEQHGVAAWGVSYTDVSGFNKIQLTAAKNQPYIARFAQLPYT